MPRDTASEVAAADNGAEAVGMLSGTNGAGNAFDGNQN
jgi:hypothetical protein